MANIGLIKPPWYSSSQIWRIMDAEAGMPRYEQPHPSNEGRPMDARPAQPVVEISPCLYEPAVSPEVENTGSDNSVCPLFELSATLEGQGRCSALLVKQWPRHLDYLDSWPELDGLDDLEDLLQEVFDENRQRAVADNGVLFWRQFDPDFDILEREHPAWKDDAWIVLFHDINVDKDHRRRGVGTALVRSAMEAAVAHAEREDGEEGGGMVLSFAKARSTTSPRDMRLLSPIAKYHRRRASAWGRKEPLVRFWESLAFERLNDGHLFSRELGWLFWSPLGRNASLLF